MSEEYKNWLKQRLALFEEAVLIEKEYKKKMEGWNKRHEQLLKEEPHKSWDH